MAKLLLLFIVAAAALTDSEEWVNFKVKYGKTGHYLDAATDAKRFSIFQSNLRAAEKLQAGDSSATYGVTQFMDLSPQEFSAMHGFNRTQWSKWTSRMPYAKPTPAGVAAMGTDWRSSEVSPVKDQGNCGNCWAFSATGAAEACYAHAHGTVVSLSVQQITDCCTVNSDGCNGGMEYDALNWALGVGMASDAAYKWTGKKGICNKNPTVTLPAGTCAFQKQIGESVAVPRLLPIGPMTIAIDATPLQFYTSGVISGTSCKYTSLDHAVLLVANTATEYTVKNSWAASWGEQGYFRMQTGVDCLSFGTDYSSVAVPK
jgi:C1A family cysteine protease